MQSDCASDCARARVIARERDGAVVLLVYRCVRFWLYLCRCV